MYKKSRSEGFGPEVKRRIMLGSFVLSSGYYDEMCIRDRKRKVQKEGVHMLQATEFLLLMRFITKSHEACIQSICREHQLSMMEATIITFLRNNPSVDTAADIAELRMLSKGQVSQAVESLVQKRLVTRQPDASDRDVYKRQPSVSSTKMVPSE